MINTPQNIGRRSIPEKILIVLIFLGIGFFLWSGIMEDIAAKKQKAVMLVEKEKYKDTATLNDLRNNVRTLERYQLEHDGIYPDNFQSSGMHFYLYDAYDREIYYKVAADKKSYDMRGLGEDGVYGTADDIVLP